MYVYIYIYIQIHINRTSAHFVTYIYIYGPSSKCSFQPQNQTIPGCMRQGIEGNFMNIMEFKGGTKLCKITYGYQDKDLIVNLD